MSATVRFVIGFEVGFVPQRKSAKLSYRNPIRLVGADMTFNHALQCALVALSVMAAVGCGPGAQAPSGDPAPTSAAQGMPEPAAPTVASRDPTYGGDIEVASARAIEAQMLKDLPEAAKREGAVLTLFSGGKAVARFTDADSPWAFAGALTLPGSNGERLFFKVGQIYFDDEGRSEWVEHWFDPAGQFIVSDTVVGQSPDRTMVAAGEYEGGDVSVHPRFSLMDWAGDPKLVYRFKSPCYPIKWISDVELEAACPYSYVGPTPQDDEIVPARVMRAGPRAWRLKQAGLPTRNMPTSPQTAPFDETVTAQELARDPEREAFLSEAGYLWLAR